MSGDAPRGDKHLKFTERSIELLGKWAESASPQNNEAVCEALMRVVEGSWRDHYRYYEYFGHRLTWNIIVNSSVMIVVRFASEYPTVAQLISIREPPDTILPW